MRIFLAIIAILVLSLAGAWVYRTWSVPASPLTKPTLTKPTLAKAKLAMKAERYDVALGMCEELLSQRSDSPAVLLLAGEAASKLERFNAALDFYQRVPDSAASDAATARWASGEIHFFLGHASQAVESLEASLVLNPRYSLAHQRLVNLLNTFGRRRETLPHLVALLQAGRASLEDLMLLGNLAKAYDAPQEVQRYLTAQPDDLLPTLGTAVAQFHSGDFPAAEQLLRRLIAQQPDLLEAHVQLGFVLEKHQPELLPGWHQQLPPDADSHPDIWFLRGQMLRARVKPSIRCFAEAIARDPNHLLAHNAIAQMLSLDGQVDRAREFADKASKLQRINIALEQIYKSKTHFDPMQEIAELTLELGRVWECMGWCGYVASVAPQLAWPQEISNRARTETQFDARSPYVMPWANLVAEKAWLAEYPLPDLSSSGTEDAIANSAEQTPLSVAEGIHFENVAASLGLNFRFDNNTAGAAAEGRHIFETTGGGVGVIDFDRDGFPDVAFVQGGTFPRATHGKQPSDQLFRNVPAAQARAFENITQAARIAESTFGQGVSVGDVNADGFDDLYVCNIGENQLWLNNGDGTFSDAGWLLPATPSTAWTCSAAIADLNLDGLPEIYDANYVTGDDVYTRICNVAGKPRGCSPLVFQPAADRVLTVGEDGRFREIAKSADAGMANSLGILVFKMADESFPRVFIAADQQANLLLRVSQQAAGDLALQDEALLTGIAYDAGGRAQACMGIAAGDVNQDGQIDLYVTNFYLEYNTLYVQSGGLFEDVTSRSGTVRETTPMLGFGTQLLDAQLDGFQDLLVLNGHIDDHTHIDIDQQMPAQVFAGQPGARFAQLDAAQAGEFFSEARLGRALAKLDFDRDGLVDAVCGDLESPAALLHNASLRSRKYVNVELVGTVSDRNAFCAIATLSSGDYRQTVQLTGGSGYQCSNQRVLNFSIPRDVQACSLQIQWPSGIIDAWTGIQPDRDYAAVESQGVYIVD